MFGPLHCSLNTGGYKAAINTTWLKRNSVTLIVNTARGMEDILGPKFKRSVVKRAETCPDIEILDFLLDDDLQQKLDIVDLRRTASRIMSTLGLGASVLVHCMQGKSRSTPLVVASLCLEWHKPVQEVLAYVQERRNMAEPNYNFLTQLSKMEANGDFKP